MLSATSSKIEQGASWTLSPALVSRPLSLSAISNHVVAAHTLLDGVALCGLKTATTALSGSDLAANKLEEFKKRMCAHCDCYRVYRSI
jgi:hypothetical protein